MSDLTMPSRFANPLDGGALPSSTSPFLQSLPPSVMAPLQVGGGQSPAPAASPGQGSSYYMSLLQSVLAKSADFGDNLTPAQRLQKVDDLAKQAASGPTKEQIEAGIADLQGKRDTSVADFMRDNPLAPPAQLTAPNYAPLDLPGVPTDVKPTPNGVASLGAGIAGLFAPHAAAEFGANALAGALAANQRENDARQQQYKLQLQQSMLKSQDDARRVDAQAAVDAQNNRANNNYTIQQHADNLAQAVTRQNAALESGTAGVLSKFVDGDKDARIAAAQLGIAKENVQMAQRQSEHYSNLLVSAAQLNQQAEHAQLVAQTAAEDRARMDRTAAAKAASDALDRQNDQAKQANDLAIARARLALEQGHLTLDQRKLLLDQTNKAEDNRIKIRGQDISAENRGGTMYHDTPEGKMALIDVQKLQAEARQAREAANKDQSDRDKSQVAITAEKRYNDARQNYMNISRQAPTNPQPNSYRDANGRLRRNLGVAQPLGVIPAPLHAMTDSELQQLQQRLSQGQ